MRQLGRDGGGNRAPTLAPGWKTRAVAWRTTAAVAASRPWLGLGVLTGLGLPFPRRGRRPGRSPWGEALRRRGRAPTAGVNGCDGSRLGVDSSAVRRQSTLPNSSMQVVSKKPRTRSFAKVIRIGICRGVEKADLGLALQQLWEWGFFYVDNGCLRRTPLAAQTCVRRDARRKRSIAPAPRWMKSRRKKRHDAVGGGPPFLEER